MPSRNMSAGSDESVDSIASNWGEGDPGMGMTGVHLRVLGGRLVWPLAFHELMAADDPRVLEPVLGVRGQAEQVFEAADLGEELGVLLARELEGGGGAGEVAVCRMACARAGMAGDAPGAGPGRVRPGSVWPSRSPRGQTRRG